MTWLRDENTSSSTKYAYKKGALAAANKEKVGDNPYDEKSNQHWSWMQGFTGILSQLSGISGQFNK